MKRLSISDVVVDWFKSRMSISTTSLAVFRVLISLIVIVDVVLRVRNFEYFYLSDGVFPYWMSATTEVWGGVAMGEVWRVVGSDVVVMFIFGVNFVSAIALLFGWKTRVSGVVMLLAVTLIDMRNGLVVSVADTYLQNLLLFAVFLPLGERLSIDSRMRNDEKCCDFDAVFSVATGGILMQVGYLYFVNGKEKLFDSGVDITDYLKLMIEYDVESYTHAELLNLVPVSVLEFSSVIWVSILFAAPITLLLQKGHVKSIFVVPYMLGHLVIATGFRIGLFPYISIAALVLFVQPQTWTVIGEKMSEVERYGLNQTALDTYNTNKVKKTDVIPKLQQLTFDSKVFNSSKGASGWNNGIALLLAILFVLGTANIGAAQTAEQGIVGEVGDNIQYITDMGGISMTPGNFFTKQAAFKDTWYVYKVNTSSGEVGDWYNNRNMSLHRPYNGSKLHYQFETFRVYFYEAKIHLDKYTQQRKQKAKYICENEEYNGSEITTIKMIEINSQYNASNRLSNSRPKTVEVVDTYNCG